MSWKSVEMQVALPRTQDAGKLQEQMDQRGQQTQHLLAKDQIELDTKKRKRVNDYQQKDDVNNKPQRNREVDRGTSNTNETNQHDEELNHPYLGKQIDING
ncbi:hypothetical protein [Aquibacillus sediminis]|uniref:hypothetical protein n=1 Tax=Aquibacillus sediminis TaxID=2574734 RepID=UPI001109CA16|nr:hypothetical protein [Aquibacillus sediminis]